MLRCLKCMVKGWCIGFKVSQKVTWKCKFKSSDTISFISSKRRKRRKSSLKIWKRNYQKKTLDFMAPFYGWGSTVSTGLTEPLRGESLLFTTKSPGGPGNHFFDLRRMKLGPRPCLIYNLKTKDV